MKSSIFYCAFLLLFIAGQVTAQSFITINPVSVVPDDYRATVISELPRGITVTGKVQSLQQESQNLFFQIVDLDALQNGGLALHIPDGFIGDLNFKVSIHFGDADNPDTYTENRSFYIEPENDDLLFAQSGSIQFDENAPVREVAIRASHGGYLVANTDDGADATSKNIGYKETFKIITLPNGNVALQTYKGKYLVAAGGGGGVLNANKDFITEDTQFEMIVHDSGQASFKTRRGHYISATVDNEQWNTQTGVVNAYPTSSNGWEKFTIVNRQNTSVPLDIITNPLLNDNARVVISGFQNNSKLIDRHGNEIPVSSGRVELAASETAGLRVDVSEMVKRIDLNVASDGVGTLPEGIMDVSLRTSSGTYVGTNNGDTPHHYGKYLNAQKRIRLIDVGDGYVAIQEYTGKFLRAVSGGGGEIRADRSSVDKHEKYKLVLHENGQVSFRTHNGHYISAVGEAGAWGNSFGELVAKPNSMGPWTKFDIVSINYVATRIPVHEIISTINNDADKDIYVSLKSRENRFVTASNGSVEHEGSHIGAEQIFRLIGLNDGYVALQASNGQYVAAENGGGGVVRANRNGIGDWEKFELISYNNGHLYLKTKVGGDFLVVNESGVLDAKGNSGDPKTGFIPYQLTKSKDFTLSVSLEGMFNGQSVSAQQSVPIVVANLSEARNHQPVLMVNGPRANYSLQRIANSLVLSHKYNPSEVIRVEMINAKYVAFNDAIVSSADFTQSIDISSVTDQLNYDPNNLVVVYDLPAGAIVNNASYLGNGAFGIPAEDVQGGLLSIDYPTLEEEARAQISVSAFTATDEQIEVLNGMVRLNGQANAEVLSQAGVESSLVFGADGISAEARAYVNAGAVATAGGTFEVDGVGSFSSEVTAEAIVAAEVEAQLQISDSEFQAALAAGVEATLSATAEVNVETEILPGTGAQAEGAVGVSAYAYVAADGGLLYGNGNYGVTGEAGAEAGAMASAEGYASGSLGGIGGGAGGGVSAGFGVGAGGGGTALYEDGELTLGVSGEVAALIGFELDVEFTVDVNAVADTGELIGNGAINSADDIANWSEGASSDIAGWSEGAAQDSWDWTSSAATDAWRAASGIAGGAWNGFIGLFG